MRAAYRQQLARQEAKQPSQSDLGFKRLDDDLWFAHHLFRHGRSWRTLEGVTGFAERRERIRREILEARLADTIVDNKHGTFAHEFLTRYGEPLSHPRGTDHAAQPQENL